VVAVRLGTNRDSRVAKSPLIVIWAADLLADPRFSEVLKWHLPTTQSGELEPTKRLARLRQTLIDSFLFEELQAFAAYLGMG
jgi:hypothetical protein